jgi:hypothetical protein
MRASRAPQSPVLLSSSEGGDNTSRRRFTSFAPMRSEA